MFLIKSTTTRSFFAFILPFLLACVCMCCGVMITLSLQFVQMSEGRIMVVLHIMILGHEKTLNFV